MAYVHTFVRAACLGVLACCACENKTTPSVAERQIDWTRRYETLVTNIDLTSERIRSASFSNFTVWERGVAMSQRHPSAEWLLWDVRPDRPAGGLTSVSDQAPMPKLGQSRALLGPADVTGVLHALGPTGRIVSVDLGGRRELKGRIGSTDLQSACLLTDSTIVYLERGQPGTVYAKHVTDTLAAPSIFELSARTVSVADSSARPRWEEWRLSASPDGPCMLWHPNSSQVVVVRALTSDTSAEASLVSIAPKIAATPYRDSILAVSAYAGGFFVLTSAHEDGGVLLTQFSFDGTQLAISTVPSTTVGMASGLNRVYLFRVQKRATMISRYDLAGVLPQRRALDSSATRTAPRAPADFQALPRQSREP